jgi:hypothetical protein
MHAMAPAMEIRLAFGPHFLHVAAKHCRYEFEFRNVRHPLGCDSAPVAHYRNAVTNLVEFVELVADENHRNAGSAQLTDDAVEYLDLVVGERRRGLVHDYQLCREGCCTGDRHHLLDGGVIGKERFLHINMDIETAQEFCRFPVHAPPIEKTETPVGAAKKYVFSD